MYVFIIYIYLIYIIYGVWTHNLNIHLYNTNEIRSIQITKASHANNHEIIFHYE